MDSGRGGGDVLIAEAVTMSLYERQPFAGRGEVAGEANLHDLWLPAIVSPCSVIRAPTQL